jgi:hypothetical protein
VKGFEGAIAGRSLKPINGGQRGDHGAFLLALSKPHMGDIVAFGTLVFGVVFRDRSSGLITFTIQTSVFSLV